jgi:hypothetical protein
MRIEETTDLSFYLDSSSRYHLICLLKATPLKKNIIRRVIAKYSLL